MYMLLLFCFVLQFSPAATANVLTICFRAHLTLGRLRDSPSAPHGLHDNMPEERN